MMFTVIFVHGTWARGRVRKGPPRVERYRLPGPWPELAHAISAVPGCREIRFLRWSGRNSHDARQEAAAILAAELMAHGPGSPDERVVIVGHSHGGTVALYAARRVPVDSRLAAVICLSTPFIETFKRDTDRLEAAATTGTSLAALVFGVAGLAAQIYGRGTSLLLGAWALAGAAAIMRRVWTRAVAGCQRFIEESSIATPATVAPIFIVRSTADEASFSLAAMQAASWLATRSYELVIRVSGAAYDWLAERWNWLLAPFGSFGIMLLWSDDRVSIWVLTIFMVLLSPLLIIIPWALFVALLAFPFGIEFVARAPFVAVSVEGTPPGLCSVFLLSASRTAQELMHSQTYQDPRAIDVVVTYIREAIDS